MSCGAAFSTWGGAGSTGTLGAIGGLKDTPFSSEDCARALSALRASASCSGVLFSPPGSGSTCFMRASCKSAGTLRPVIVTTTTSASTASDATDKITNRRGPALPEPLNIRPETDPQTFRLLKFGSVPDITMDP